ncbi:MAG: chemotaxis protein CheX [Spirochaetaceae bacterium]|nr:MAG: chemotaxis protein CheX [Spirochaetaceae bacterium]
MNRLPGLALDALTEIINIGVGRAAGSLNDITGKHITLKVPDIRLVPVRELRNLVEVIDSHRRSLIVQQFHGDFTGTAALFFPTESALRLVSAITEEEEADDGELDTIHAGTLVEIGNIVLNGVLGSLSNTLGSQISFSLPFYSALKNYNDLLPDEESSTKEHMILFVETVFQIKELAVSGFLFIVFAIQTIDSFIDRMRRFVPVNDDETVCP